MLFLNLYNEAFEKEGDYLYHGHEKKVRCYGCDVLKEIKEVNKDGDLIRINYVCINRVVDASKGLPKLCRSCNVLAKKEDLIKAKLNIEIIKDKINKEEKRLIKNKLEKKLTMFIDRRIRLEKLIGDYITREMRLTRSIYSFLL